MSLSYIALDTDRDGMSTDAIIFDLDGTLLDTLADLAASANHMLIVLGAETHATDTYKQLIGDGIRTLVRLALPDKLRDRETVTRGVELMRDEYGRRWSDATRPYPGVEELLSELDARRLPMAVLSNKPHDFTREIVSTFLGNIPFRRVIGARPSAPKKPDPTTALEIAASIDAIPGRTFFVGDSGVDMKTAVNAGMVPIGVSWGFRTADELRHAGARILLGKPSELLCHVE
ncbi:HAD family hydrolase [Myxococcota bacterium]